MHCLGSVSDPVWGWPDPDLDPAYPTVISNWDQICVQIWSESGWLFLGAKHPAKQKMLYQDAAKCSFHLLDTYDLLLFFVLETSWEVKQNLWVTNWSNGLRCLTSCEAIGAVSGSNLQSVHFVYSGWLWSKIYENIVFQSFRKLLFVVTLFYHKEREFSLFTLYSFISIIISLR